MDSERLYLYILSLLPIRQISIFEGWREKAGSFEKVVDARPELLNELGFNHEMQMALKAIKQKVSTEQLSEKLEQESISLLPYYDELYPRLLKEIFDPPAVLFYKGVLLDGDEACIGTVGTRMMSVYGKAVLPKITTPLIASGCTIVSGLAYGVDAAAHSEAIKHQARTIAVLGSGLDDASLYPKHHVDLARQILEHNGLLLSEHPPGTPAFKQHFVARNRIIAGMSLGTVVVECKSKSGALITADYAMDFNRPVYAVPGPIYSAYSAGPHELIKQGAVLVTSGEDILEDLKITMVPPILNSPDGTPEQKLVLECMQLEPKTFEQLLQQTRLSSGNLLAILGVLELNGLLKKVGQEFITT